MVVFDKEWQRPVRAVAAVRLSLFLSECLVSRSYVCVDASPVQQGGWLSQSAGFLKWQKWLAMCQAVHVEVIQS
jgi:hypothetical protein